MSRYSFRNVFLKNIFRPLKTSCCVKEMDVQAVHILNPILINGIYFFYKSEVNFKLIFYLFIIL